MTVLKFIFCTLIIVGIAWLFSENKKKFPIKIVVVGVLLQIVLAFVFLKIPQMLIIFEPINKLVGLIQEASLKGCQFMFGYLAGGEMPFVVKEGSGVFIVAFQVLPMIILVSALSAILFELGILPRIISIFSWVLKKSFRFSGALGFGAASTVFFGTIEAPLLVKPFLTRFSRSELNVLITCSMSTISGTVMVLYASILKDFIEQPLTHLLVASLLSVPAAIVISSIMVPAKDGSGVVEDAELPYKKSGLSIIEVILKSISEGLSMVFNIVAVIITLFALIHLVNLGIASTGYDIKIEQIVGVLFRPLLFLSGLSWGESGVASDIMGTKIVLNEFVAYLELQKHFAEFVPKSQIIITYCLCGFANFASVGIIVGGMNAILPDRTKEISQLCFKSLLAGNLAVLMTGSVVGLIL